MQEDGGAEMQAADIFGPLQEKCVYILCFSASSRLVSMTETDRVRRQGQS